MNNYKTNCTRKENRLHNLVCASVYDNRLLASVYKQRTDCIDVFAIKLLFVGYYSFPPLYMYNLCF